MKYQQLLIAFCFSTLFVELTYAGQHLCARDEAFYLLQFKQGLRTDCDNKSLSWNITGDCCEWDGVTCNEFTGHVIGLDLSWSCLKEAINANNSLTKLGHLERLNLAFNKFDDFPLGNSVSELGSLTHLNLSNSGFYGWKMIPPGLSKLSKLVSLDLSSNYLSGSISESVGNLTAIRELRLSDNGFTGNVFSTISKLNKLVHLDLSSNHFRGSIPESVGNLIAIRELRLSDNGFTGNVLSTISKLNKLVELDLSSNHFRGSIPESIGNLTGITTLNLTNNSFRALSFRV